MLPEPEPLRAMPTPPPTHRSPRRPDRSHAPPAAMPQPPPTLFRADRTCVSAAGTFGAGLASRPVEPDSARSPLAALLDQYHPEGDPEKADLRRVRALATAADDPWRRDLPLHVTSSALIT